MGSELEPASPAPPADPVVDVHTHALPLPLLRRLERDGLADLSQLPTGSVHIDQRVSGVPPGTPIPCVPEQYDPAARLRLMDEAGVDVHLVSAPPFVFGLGLPDRAPMAALMRHTNDALAELAAACPERLRPLGVVLLGLPEAADEARRCLVELGFAGVSIGSRGLAGELDHPDHEPLWDWLASTGTFTLLHPSGTPAPGRLAGFHLTQLLGFPLEAALAAHRLIAGGVLDRHDLRLCLCHGGSCVYAVTPRLDLAWQAQPDARTSERRPTAYLRRFYYDTAMTDPGRLQRLVADAGADRVLLGTDAPFDLADRQPRRAVAELGLPPDDQRRILGGTVAGLLPDRRTDPVTTH